MTWIGLIWLEWVIKGFVLCLILLTGFAYLTWYERRALARMQVRVGPNRAGPQGLLQPIADAVKLIFKEEFTPNRVYKVVFILAPVLTVVPSLILAAVIPLGTSFNLFGREITLYVANVNVGVLYIMSIASIAVYGIVLAGWSSNNKYAMLGGIRSSAQMISYELALGLSFAVAIVMGNSMNLIDIVNAAKRTLVCCDPACGRIDLLDRDPCGSEPRAVRYARSRTGIDRRLSLGIFRHEVRFVLHGRISEDDRDLHDHGDIVLWRLSWPVVLINIPLLGPVYLFGKVVILLFAMIWVRATWPRIRYDRLMAFGWKILLPLSLVDSLYHCHGIVLAQELNNQLYIWSIPVLSIISAIVAVMIIYRDLRRKSHGRI